MECMKMFHFSDWQQKGSLSEQQSQQQQQDHDVTTGHQQQQQQETQQERSEAGEVAVGGRETEGRVEGLTPAMQYLFTIYAHNAMGPSKPSEVGYQ